MTQIKIEFENISIDAVLNDSETANKIKKILPISNSVILGEMRFIFQLV